MAAMKTMTAIAVDARPSMAGSVSRDGVSKINVALGITSHHIVQRQMASKTVEFSVSAFGAGVTKNSRHAEDGSCVNVETVCEMGKPSVDDLRRVDGITAGGDDAGDCDFVDAIDVALDNLKRVNAGKKYNRIMLIITDGEFVVSDMEPLEHLLRDMKANDISLYVAIVGHKDKELVSNIVSENGKLLASMVGATGGAFCVVDQISDSFYFFAGRPGMTSRPLNYKIPLYISPSVKIRCQYWSKVSKATLPSLKKQSPSYDPEQPDSGTVKRTTSYFNPDDPDQEIPFDEKVKGYRYGANYVPVSAADEAALKISSEPLMRLIGFLPESKILRYHFLESTLVLQGDASSPVAESALSALSIALREKKSVALVRFVKRADSDPWLAALIPFPSDSSCLMIQRLPCAEDIRDFPFPSLYDKRYGKPNTKAQMTAVSNFVDQLTITPDDIAVFNPSFPALTAKILRNVLSESKSPNSLLAEVGNPLCGPAEIRDRADGALKRVLSEFSLTTVDKKKKKRKIYWSDYEVAASTEDVLQQSSVAIAESKESEPEATLTTGSTNPIEDFNRDISTNSKLVQQVALNNMSTIIVNLVIEGGTPAHYRKAIACILALRTAAISTLNPSSFNQFLLEQIKNSFSSGGRHKRFWDELTLNPVFPISDAEVVTSDISSSIARNFYAVDSGFEVMPSQKVVVTAEDDLFDDLE